jgi:hypothetical protein
MYIYVYMYILWIGLHSHWQRAPQPAKLSSSFSNQRTASKQDCPKWQGFMDMQGSATTKEMSPRLYDRTASSSSSNGSTHAIPPFTSTLWARLSQRVLWEVNWWKTWRLEGTACLPMIFGGCNDDGFTIYIYIYIHIYYYMYISSTPIISLCKATLLIPKRYWHLSPPASVEAASHRHCWAGTKLRAPNVKVGSVRSAFHRSSVRASCGGHFTYHFHPIFWVYITHI